LYPCAHGTDTGTVPDNKDPKLGALTDTAKAIPPAVGGIYTEPLSPFIPLDEIISDVVPEILVFGHVTNPGHGLVSTFEEGTGVAVGPGVEVGVGVGVLVGVGVGVFVGVGVGVGVIVGVGVGAGFDPKYILPSYTAESNVCPFPDTDDVTHVLSVFPAGCVSDQLLAALLEKYNLVPFPIRICCPSADMPDIYHCAFVSPAGRVSDHEPPLLVDIYNLPF
jgi:hypothetical protein